jgi:hypothetical protein
MDMGAEMTEAFPVTLVIEGVDAVEAAEALLQDPELKGSQEQVDTSDQRDLDSIATVVTIIGETINGLVGLANLAEKFIKWREQQKSAGKKIDKAILINKNSDRLLLEGATIEEIQHLLKE